MADLGLLAATEWARAHASRIADPVAFGIQVAVVYEAAVKQQSQAALVDARPAPMQCDARVSTTPPQAVGQMLTPAPEYAPAQREHLPVWCSADVGSHRL